MAFLNESVNENVLLYDYGKNPLEVSEIGCSFIQHIEVFIVFQIKPFSRLDI